MRFQQLLQLLPWSRARSSLATGPDGASTASATGSRPGEVVLPDRLDLQAAVIHHLEWCVLYNEHLAVDPNRSRHIAPLTDADESPLGRWLNLTVARCAHLDARLVELQQEHGRFHAVARQALALARNQRMDLASTLLNTDFERSRARILELLREMQKG